MASLWWVFPEKEKFCLLTKKLWLIQLLIISFGDYFFFFLTKYVDGHFNVPFSTCVTWHCRLRWSQKSSLCSTVEQILNSRLSIHKNSIHPSNQFRLVGADWGLSQLSEEEEDGWMDKYNCYSATLPHLL